MDNRFKIKKQNFDWVNITESMTIQQNLENFLSLKLDNSCFLKELLIFQIKYLKYFWNSQIGQFHFESKSIMSNLKTKDNNEISN